MPTRQSKRIKRTLTAEERERIRSVRIQVEAEKEEILALARRCKAEHDSAAATLRNAFSLLKAERQVQGLSLQDLEDRTGISRAALSRLENAPEPNPTVTTLLRVADALGKRLEIVLTDR